MRVVRSNIRIRRPWAGRLSLAIVVLLAATGLLLFAAPISAPPTAFAANTPIKASEVNDDFTALYNNDTALNGQLFWGAVTGGIGYSAGNVGIGTATPGARLEVSTGAQFPLRLVGNDTYQTAFSLQNTTSADAVWSICVGGSGNNAGGAGVGGFGIWGGVQPQAFRLSINANGNVGVGTTNPLAKLCVEGGPYNSSGLAVRNNDVHLLLTEDPVTNAGKIQVMAGGSANAIGTAPYRLALNPQGGNVGIGTVSPDQLLSVNGDASKAGGGSWATFSDIRLKDVHRNVPYGLGEIEGVHPIFFSYKAGNQLGLPAGGENAGYSAQEVKELMPEAVSVARNGYLMLDQDLIIAALVNSVKELKAQKDEEVGALREEVDALKEALRLQGEVLDAIRRELGR